MIDKIRGSLVGGAIGDALGYPVEFINTFEKIQDRYGSDGITRFDLKPHWLNESEHTGKAIVSDDTQMTMFTACGLLNANKLGISYKESIQKAYLEWLTTQEPDFELKNEPKCWIMAIPELHKRRAPGHTCITALSNIARKLNRPNHSKGCGGVMRVAPIPLFAVANNRMSIIEADRLAGDAAAITHHHPLGIIPAAMMSHIIYRLLQDNAPTRAAFEGYIHESMDAATTLYPEDERYLDEMSMLIDQTIKLATNDLPDVTNIEHLGGGWVAEETLAIALYCTLRHYPTDSSQQALADAFERNIVAAVNHAGDSDSTGAVTGNIIGAITGYDSIPQYYQTDLEHHEAILRLGREIIAATSTKA